MRAFIYLTVFFTQISFAFASGSLTDSSAAPVDSITKKVDYYMLKASLSTAKSPAQAIKYYRSALITNKVTDDIWEANIRTEMGRLLSRLNNKEAVSQFTKADALFKKQMSIFGRVDARTGLAQYYEKTGNFTAAKKVYDELYKLQLSSGEAVLAGNTAYHLTNYYLKKQNLAEAFNYADKAKDAYYLVCRKDSLASIYSTIANIKKKQNKPKLAEYYVINHALPYYRSSDDLQGRLKSFDFLGQLYLQQQRYSEAKWFYLQANSQAKEVQDTAAVVRSLMQLTLVKILIKDYQLAKQDLKEATELAKQSNNMAIVDGFKRRNPVTFKKLDSPVLAAVTTSKPSEKAKISTSKINKKTENSSPATTYADNQSLK